ncbi:MAG: cadherin domain-containing protein [Cyclobacteriaceae bacterium]
MKRYIIISLIALVCMQGLMASIPNWTVNSADYSNSMSMVGAIKINGQESLDENDMIAAFIDGELRGVAQVQLEQAVNRYIAFLIIYSNQSGGEITFKLYDASADAELSAYNTSNFAINGLKGDLANPIVWSDVLLKSENDITAFSFAGSDGDAIIDAETIKLPVTYSTDRSTLSATFTASEGATVWVADVQQVSGESANDFSEPVVFTVVSEDEQHSKSYSVEVFNTNNPPTDINLDISTIDENKAELSNVGSLLVEDDDEVHIYSFADGLGDNDNDLFKIIDDQFIARRTFDFEIKNVYSVRLKVKDSAGQEYIKILEINVNDVNEKPTDIVASDVLLDEDTPLQSTIAILSTVDEDENDTFIYSLSESFEDNAFFSVVDNELISATTFNYEEKDEYSLRIIVKDAGDNLFEKSIVLSVVDKGDQPTNILINSVEIEEELPKGSIIGVFNTVDEDVQDEFAYSMSEGEGDTDNSHFGIDGNRLVSRTVFDAETETSYSVRVKSEDSKGNAISKSYAITVLQVNEVPEIESQLFSVPERSSPGTSVGAVLATDVDGDQLIYTIMGSGGPFSIDPSSGEVSVSVEAIDYEEVSSYRLEIQVADPGGLLAYAEITIDIEDVIESEFPLPANDFISANGDGFNDLFLVQNVSLYQSYTLAIFNNSGTEVYSKTGYDNTWSGTDNSGHDLAPGIYYYSFISPSNPISFRGSLTLVR